METILDALMRDGDGLMKALQEDFRRGVHMHLERHYQSYREQVQLDALPGYVEYASRTQTANPEQFPTVLDYLKFSTNALKQAVAAGHEQEYCKHLVYHQEACLMLFRRMFDEMLDKQKDRVLATLDLVEKLGWRSFKFSDLVMHFDKFHVIPRYSKSVMEYINGELPCLSADEMDRVMVAAPEDSVVEDILRTKRERKVFITSCEKIAVTFVALEERNIDVVRDWVGKFV